jgi:hypothetical protein
MAKTAAGGRAGGSLQGHAHAMLLMTRSPALRCAARAALEKYLTSVHKKAEQAKQSQQPQHQAASNAPADMAWVARVLFILLLNPLNGDGAGIGGQLVMRISRIIAGTLQGAQRAAVRQVGWRLHGPGYGSVLWVYVGGGVWVICVRKGQLCCLCSGGGTL